MPIHIWYAVYYVLYAIHLKNMPYIMKPRALCLPHINHYRHTTTIIFGMQYIIIYGIHNCICSYIYGVPYIMFCMPYILLVCHTLQNTRVLLASPQPLQQTPPQPPLTHRWLKHTTSECTLNVIVCRSMYKTSTPGDRATIRERLPVVLTSLEIKMPINWCTRVIHVLGSHCLDQFDVAVLYDIHLLCMSYTLCITVYHN